jgi:4-hydroxybenzoate polyprenyltransferase
MAGYLSAMYPIPVRIGSAILLSLSVFATLARINGSNVQLISPLTLLGIWNVFSLGLILRLMDELKDADVDRRLFAHRPLPAGRVYISDIRWTLIVVCVGFLLANLTAGPAFWMAVVVLAYALLMFHYFFAPQLLRRFLLLNLATHNPIVALMILNLVALFAVAWDVSVQRLISGSTLLLVVMYWLLLFSWEIARKIRAPSEEDEYVTYSRLFGRAWAVALAATAQTAVLAAGLWFCRTWSSIWPFIIIAGAGYANLMYEYARFLLNKRANSSDIKRFTETYVASVWFAMLVAMAFWSC